MNRGFATILARLTQRSREIRESPSLKQSPGTECRAQKSTSKEKPAAMSGHFCFKAKRTRLLSNGPCAPNVVETGCQTLFRAIRRVRLVALLRFVARSAEIKIQ